jgi:hypothetical protein
MKKPRTWKEIAIVAGVGIGAFAAMTILNVVVGCWLMEVCW